MNTDLIDDTPIENLAEDVTGATQRVTDAAKAACKTVAAKVEDSVERSKVCVRQNPIPVLLGALVCGVAVGCLVARSCRREASLQERLAEDPVNVARAMIYSALAPLGKGLHEGYDSARDGVGKAMHRLHAKLPSSRADSLGDQLGRVLGNLKFW